MTAREDTEAIGELERATDALLAALRRQPEPDLEAAAEALEARRLALRVLSEADPSMRSADQAARLVRVLERDVEASRRIEAEMSAISGRLKALDSLRERIREDSQAGAGEPPGGPATGTPAPGVSAGEIARVYGNAPTANRPSRKGR